MKIKRQNFSLRKNKGENQTDTSATSGLHPSTAVKKTTGMSKTAPVPAQFNGNGVKLNVKCSHCSKASKAHSPCPQLVSGDTTELAPVELHWFMPTRDLALPQHHCAWIGTRRESTCTTHNTLFYFEAIRLISHF